MVLKMKDYLEMFVAGMGIREERMMGELDRL